MKKGGKAQRNPKMHRGISGNGSNQKGGGSTGKHSGGMMDSGRTRGSGKSTNTGGKY